MKKIKIKNLKILLFALIWMLCRPILSEAAVAPEYGSLTIYNRDSESEPVSGVEYTIWQVDESSGYRPGTPEEAKTHLIENTKQSKKTDADGKAVFASLPAGIYYVTESDLGNMNASAFKNAPFLAEIPMTNAEGTGWIADVEVYLKNQPLGIDKFVNGAGDDNYDTKDISRAKHRPVGGEEVFGYTIVSYFPSEIGQTAGESYVVTDQLNEYIEGYPDTLKVYAVSSKETAVQNGYLLTEGQHYEKVLERGTNLLTVSLTEAGMDLLNERSKSDSFLLIKFDCQLREDASNGVNIYGKATLSYKKGVAASGRAYTFSTVSTARNNPGNLLTVSVSEEPEVHTGQIGIAKVNAKNEEQKLANAKFGISRSEAAAKAGEYTATGTTDKNGNLVFRGLRYGQPGDDCEQNSDATTYWLIEIEAPSGYSRVQDPIEVEFQYQEDNREFYFAKVMAYNQPKGTTVDKPKKNGGVKTGDTASIVGLAVVLVISLVAIVIILKKKKLPK